MLPSPTHPPDDNLQLTRGGFLASLPKILSPELCIHTGLAIKWRVVIVCRKKKSQYAKDTVENQHRFIKGGHSLDRFGISFT